jgi:hypothetical protein
MATPRWEGDEVGAGVGDAGELAPGVRGLLEAMVEPTWVTEDPHIHLRPRLRHVVEDPSSPWLPVEEVVVLAVYVVTLDWQRRDGTLADLRRDVFSLVGAVAGPSTHVQERLGSRVEYDVTTGTTEGDDRFRPHGHALRLRIEGHAARRLL